MPDADTAPQQPDQSPAPPHAAGPAHRYTGALAARIEERWRDWWADHETFRQPNPGEPGFDPGKPKFYCLDMFPYPSGAGLHVGHPEGYIATDIISRFKRMTGVNVLHPMGWDAFGLPAEQYAIQTGVHPADTTRAAIDNFRRQLQRFGFSYDWSRELATIDPDYYKWTQWIFLRLYHAWFDPRAAAARPVDDLVRDLEAGELLVTSDHTVVPKDSPRAAEGRLWTKLDDRARRAAIDNQRLAYLGEQTVNWCPQLGTVLANEEVIDGRSERGGHPVTRTPLRQWMLRITAYAERLLDGLDHLDWPESTKAQQREWIGKSRGAFADFEAGKRRIRVFTTRPDTLFGATYMVLAPEHPLVDELAPAKYGDTVPTAWRAAGFPGADELAADPAKAPRDAIDAYRAWVATRSDVDRQADDRTKSGVFTGAYAVNPASGDRVPVFIADYVLMGYGSGAIMAVPAHDERDYEFAKQFHLPIKDVVYSRTLLAMRHFFRHATEEEARGERWFWTLADLLGYVTSNDTPPADFPAALELVRNTRREDPDARPTADVDATILSRDVPAAAGSVGERRGAVRVQWMDAIEAIGFTSFAQAKQWFDDAAFFANTGSAYTAQGFNANSGPLDNLPTDDAKRTIITHLERSKHGRGATTYKLRDWLFSRQRYWGEPFPIVFDESGDHHPVNDDKLPVALPPLADFSPDESDEPTPLLGKAAGWRETTAADAGVSALPPDARVTRELNTMPNWAGSCWYYLRYTDPANNDRLAGDDAQRYWMGDAGVDLYVGGAEHAVLHLLYARFWHMVLHDLGHVSSPEPFRRLFHQGLILSFAYQRADKSLVPVDAVENRGDADAPTYIETETGDAVAQIVAKMSKSLRNVVNPDDVIAEFGADTFRLYEMFMGPLEASKPWNTTDILGMFRFLQRAWRLAVSEDTGELLLADAPDEAVEKALHRTIDKAAGDIDRLSFNTAIAALIEFVNLATKAGRLTRDQLHRFARALAPFTPHLAEELWSRLGEEPPVSLADWPEVDPKMLVDDEVEIPVQIKGKVRAKITAPADATPDQLEQTALASERVQQLLEGRPVRKVIAVPGKMVNIVPG